MTEKPYEFGLYVCRHRPSYDRGSIRISVGVVMRDEGGDYPCNVNLSRTASWDKRCPKRLRGMNLEDLGMLGHVFESRDQGNTLIGYEPEYRNVYCIDLRKAETITKTLKALERAKERWRKKNGYGINPSQMMAILAAFVGAKFVVFRDEVDHPSKAMFYRDNGPWTFLPVALGIDKYAVEVDRMEREYKAEERIRA